MTVRLLSLALTVLILAGCGAESTEQSGGHEHADGITLSTTEWSEETELFFERPQMVASHKSAPWAIHVTRLDGHQPLTEGRLTLRFRRPDGAAYVHELDAPSEPGIFTPQPTIPEAGTFRLFMIVEGTRLQDTVEIGNLTVYESASATPSPEAGSAEISYLKEQQWETEFGVARARERSVQQSIEASGTIEPVPGQYAKISAPVSGLTPAEANLDMPAPGDGIRKGETLAVLSPSGGEGSYADVKGRVERLKREVRRAKRLVKAEAIPEKQLVEARHELELAQAALKSMGEASETTTSQMSNTSGGDSDFNYQLRSPIGGQVHERHLAPGSRVEVGEVLYTIVDPSRVRVHVRVPAEHAADLQHVSEGMFTVEGSEVLHRASRIVSSGAVIDTDTRTLPVRLEASNPDGRLKIGMMANARLLLENSEAGVTIPNAAIQMEDGEPVAYVQTGGESFERRPLQLGPTNGKHTLVKRGVQAGEHVVTAGAYQVYLASLGSSETAGHGHTH
ncbi:efflux RND transporter periplasmic adaptor subunit [Salinibacter sp.]|uniref:efflux RND transporter periplasmic adaptor subunit n=1 Tax=Salinibacter sp. TaxID=2065818 RepID=UPI0021E95B6F|nr:efflux RND transporter periplasmic adaptor subunit [Salinibacter sp.]